MGKVSLRILLAFLSVGVITFIPPSQGGDFADLGLLSPPLGKGNGAILLSQTSSSWGDRREIASQVLGKLPLLFAPHQKQSYSSSYLCQTQQGRILLFPDQVLISLPGSSQDPEGFLIRMRLIGARSDIRGIGLESHPGKVHYFLGGQPSLWREEVRVYRKVKYQKVYPGVDLVYYGHQQRLKYDFILSPYGDLPQITLAFESLKPQKTLLSLELDPHGNFWIKGGPYRLKMEKPLIYQEGGGKRRIIPGGFVLKGDNRVAFKVGPYNKSKPLVIDPELAFSSYLGGSGDDVASGVAVDPSGNVYVVGWTNFPSFLENWPSPPSSGNSDVFVAKLSANRYSLDYLTYLGGAGLDRGTDIAVDSLGNAYITGVTVSTDFPTVNPLQGRNQGNSDAFIVQLTPDGKILYSTYLGGSQFDIANSIAIDPQGNVLITGGTHSPDFPLARPLYRYRGNGDAFVAKLHLQRSQLIYSTYLGGENEDLGYSIAVDTSGNAYIAGQTSSNFFPLVRALQPSLRGLTDAFVTEINPLGSAILFSTYLGGSAVDIAYAITTDSKGAIYLTGLTNSTDFPIVKPLQGSNHGFVDAFIVKMSPSGPSLLYSTYLGGTDRESGSGIAVDPAGNVYVTGITDSTDFPLISPLQSGFGGIRDVFVVKINPEGSGLIYSTYLGGQGMENGWDDLGDIAVDAEGNAYVSGSTTAGNFPVTRALQNRLQGSSDAFLVKISESVTPTSDLEVKVNVSSEQVLTGSPLIYTISLTNKGPDVAESVVVKDTLPLITTFKDCSATHGGICGGSENLRTITFPSLSPGESAMAKIVVTLDCTIPDGMEVVNSVTAGSSSLDPDFANNSAVAKVKALNPPPKILCPPDIVLPTDPGQCSATLSFDAPTVEDNCSEVTLTCFPLPGTHLPLGETTVTCIAKDAGGASSTCSFKVAVKDREPPQILCPQPLLLYNEPGKLSARGIYPKPEITDNCSEPVKVSFLPPSGSEFPLGESKALIVATDSAGNRSVCSFKVMVRPTIHPPGLIKDLRAEATGSTSVQLSWTAPGDQGNAGLAARYDLRYSLEPITKETFDQAVPIPSPPKPLPPGSLQTFQVYSLEEDKVYYFAIKTQGITGLWSDLSNVTSVYLPGPPPRVLSVLPEEGSLQVPPDAPIVITFSRPMAPQSLKALIRPSLKPLTLTWSSDYTQVIISHPPFRKNFRYVFMIITVQDQRGRVLPTSFTWSFSTAGGPQKLSEPPWPMLGHDPQHTGRSGFTGPLEPTVLWMIEIPSLFSPPVIGQEGTIYIPSGGGQAVVAVSIEGAPMWRYGSAGGVRSSPALFTKISPEGIKEEVAYVGLPTGELVALNSQGEVLWSLPTGERNLSSPTVGPSGTLYLGAGVKVFAVSPEGRIKWEFPTQGLVLSSPALSQDEKVLYVGSEDGNLYALDSETGTKLWSFQTLGGIRSSPLVTSDSLIIFTTITGELFALESTGRLRWRLTLPGATFPSNPVLSKEGIIYISASQGLLYAINPDGTERWPGGLRLGAGLVGSPLVDQEGTIYVGTSEGSLLAFRPDGSVKWQFNLGDPVVSSPLLGPDGFLIVSTQKHLFALGNPPFPLGLPLGDIDGDGKADLRDVRLALRIAAGLVVPSFQQIQAGDLVGDQEAGVLMGDGKVDLQDVYWVMRIIAGI